MMNKQGEIMQGFLAILQPAAQSEQQSLCGREKEGGLLQVEVKIASLTKTGRGDKPGQILVSVSVSGIQSMQ